MSKRVKGEQAQKSKPPKTRKSPEKKGKTTKKEYMNAIIGIGLLLVVVSIAYSTAVILIGVNSIESRILLIPQVGFALIILIKAFTKLYKEN